MKNKLSFFVVFSWFFSWFLIVIVFIFSFLSENSYILEDLQLNPLDYARITDVDYKAVVVDEPDSRGKVVITERLTFDIHAASSNNLFWELWRDLPEDYVDGVKVEYKVNSVKQIYPDGTEVIYEESPKLYWDDYDYISPTYGPGKWYHSEGPYNEDAARYECVFFYVDGLYREEVVFEVEYEMYNAALRYNDCSDLYLALYSETTINHLESYKAQILFPNKDMPSPGNYEVFTYGTNAHQFPVYESADMNPGYYTFYFELDEKDLQFKSYNEYIEFDLVSYGEDKHIFTEYAPSNYYSGDDVLEEIYEEQQDYANILAKYKAAKLTVFSLMLAGSVLVLIYAFRTDARMKAKHYFFQPTMEIDYYRDIPSDLDPNFAASLVFCKHKPPKDDSGVYSAILLSLARKKYIDVQELSYENIQITIIKKEPPKPIPPVTPTGLGQTTLGYGSQTSSSYSGQGTYDYSTQNPYDSMAQTNSSYSTLNSSGYEEPTNTSYSTLSSSGYGQGTSSDYLGPDTSDFGVQTTSSYMEQTVDSNITPEIPEEIYEPLTPCEEYYFNLIVRHATNNTISMNELKNRISSDLLYGCFREKYGQFHCKHRCAGKIFSKGGLRTA